MHELVSIKNPMYALVVNSSQVNGMNAGSTQRIRTSPETHSVWAQLIQDSPQAAQLGHVIVASLDNGNAVVASEAELAEMAKMSVEQVQRALKTLSEHRWIEVANLEDGTTAYIWNPLIAWNPQRREIPEGLRFEAQVSCDTREVPEGRIPVQLMNSDPESPSMENT